MVRVAPYVLDLEAQNRTVEIEVELDDKELAAQFLPGTSADVEVIREARDGVLRIPTVALLEGGRVLVPNGGTLEKRDVRVGLRNWNYAEIQTGLNEGELVVVTLDRPGVEPGARIQIEDDESEAP